MVKDAGNKETVDSRFRGNNEGESLTYSMNF